LCVFVNRLLQKPKAKSQKDSLLLSEGFIWLISELSHSKNTVVYENTNTAQRMDRASKVPAMMYERICPTPS